MSIYWHELIQRHMSGHSSAEESAALHEALKNDAELRSLYLDYMNLDVALGAIANAAPVERHRAGSPANIPYPWAQRPARRWRWLAPAAACAALVLFGVYSGRRIAAPAPPGLGEATTSARTAIARLRTPVPPPIPTWMSPTSSLLQETAHTQ